jgi:hypothetical protein
VRVLLEEVVLHGPEGMEAELVGAHRLLQHVLVGPVLLLAAEGPGDRNLVEERELHGVLPCAGGAEYYRRHELYRRL